MLFLVAALPSALLGLFPLWLGMRQGRAGWGVAAMGTCIAFGGVTYMGAASTSDVFGSIVWGALSGLLAAVAMSVVLLRTSP